MSGPMWRSVAVLGCALAPALAGAEEPLRVRVSETAAVCFEQAFVRAGLEAVVEKGDPAQTRGADVIVGEESSLVRTLEGGRVDARRAVDLGFGAGGPRPSMVIAAVVADSPHAARAQRLLTRLEDPRARAAFAQCAGASADVRALASTLDVAAYKAGAARYAVTVVDSWLPVCSSTGNQYNDTAQVLGAPNAVNLGGKDNYRGFMSLGQGGWVVVDMGQVISNAPGADVRIYQAQADEPVTLYAGDQPGGPFRLVGFRRSCGTRTPGLFAGYCDFDLADASLASARYLRVEDGELYPCLRAGTVSEGADIDAVELLNP